MKRLALITMMLASCSSTSPKRRPVAVVDISDQTLRLERQIFRATSARRGTGNRPGSYQTPLGVHTVVDKWHPGDPRYHGAIKGYKLHLAGPDCPPGRRIYAHKGKTDGNWSRGCVHLAEQDLVEVWHRLPVGSQFVIRP